MYSWTLARRSRMFSIDIINEQVGETSTPTQSPLFFPAKLVFSTYKMLLRRQGSHEEDPGGTPRRSQCRGDGPYLRHTGLWSAG